MHAPVLDDPSMLAPAPSQTATRFAATFTAAVNSTRAAEVVPQLSLQMLLKLVTILELLGARVPPEFLRALRAHDMSALADSLEVRNRLIDEDEQHSRAQLRRTRDLVAAGASA